MRGHGTACRRALRLTACVAVISGIGTIAAVVRTGAGTGPQAALADAMQVHAAHGASFVPGPQGKRPVFILALGSDARPGESAEGQRADSIHVIGIDPVRHRATILGLPRDSWVAIPGHGTNKLNTAMALGGPTLMVRTVESITGLRMDFWLLTSFRGLVNMVNRIGGLTLEVPRAMDDVYSGAHFSPGRHHVNGQQALAFSRDRHDFIDGDITRSENQGRVLLAALSRLHASFQDSPSTLFGWIAAGWQNMQTDLSVATLLDLALTAIHIPPAGVNNLVVPAAVGTVGSASVVFITRTADSVYADMRADGVVG